jgi:hypothetical protein
MPIVEFLELFSIQKSFLRLPLVVDLNGCCEEFAVARELVQKPLERFPLVKNPCEALLVGTALLNLVWAFSHS